MPLPLTISCFSKIQIGFAFLVPAHLGSPGKSVVKRVCVCVCVRACVRACVFYEAGYCVLLVCILLAALKGTVHCCLYVGFQSSVLKLHDVSVVLM